MHSLMLVEAYNVPSIILDIAVNEREENSCPHGDYIQVGKTHEENKTWK